VTIDVVREVTDEVLEALHRLVPQLSGSADPLTRDELHTIVSSPGVSLLLARDAEGRIVGTLTLGVLPAPTGVRAWIEDVVVDEGARGQGVGEALTAEALELARAAGARTVDLTTRPAREAANRLYERVGFLKRETNVYRYSL
jgi:ribosomal protein S18 acetylase RimI-like enzyme